MDSLRFFSNHPRFRSSNSFHMFFYSDGLFFTCLASSFMPRRVTTTSMLTLGLCTNEFNFRMVFESNKAALLNVSAFTAFVSMALPRHRAWCFSLINERQRRRDARVNGVARRKKAARALPDPAFPCIIGMPKKTRQVLDRFQNWSRGALCTSEELWGSWKKFFVWS